MKATSDYTAVTFKTPDFKSNRTVRADDYTRLIKSTDPRAPGAGIEIIYYDALEAETSREFVSIDNVASLIFAPVAGKVPVAEGEKAGKK